MVKAHVLKESGLVEGAWRDFRPDETTEAITNRVAGFPGDGFWDGLHEAANSDHHWDAVDNRAPSLEQGLGVGENLVLFGVGQVLHHFKASDAVEWPRDLRRVSVDFDTRYQRLVRHGVVTDSVHCGGEQVEEVSVPAPVVKNASARRAML